MYHQGSKSFLCVTATRHQGQPDTIMGVGGACEPSTTTRARLTPGLRYVYTDLTADSPCLTTYYDRLLPPSTLPLLIPPPSFSSPS